MYKQDFYSILTSDIVKEISELGVDKNKICEIRLRKNKRITLSMDNREIQLDLKCFNSHLEEIMDKASNYSLYAHEEQLKNGFLTTCGGIRVGVCANILQDEYGKVICLKNISSVNIRIPTQKIGISDKALRFVYDEHTLLNTLIISPPGCGKTTFLRDFIRNVSGGNKYFKGLNVGLVDERCEVAAFNENGIAFDLGDRCDVYLGARKNVGIMMLLRSMRPDVIAVDEIEPQKESKDLQHIITCGVSLLATIHGKNMNDIRKKCARDIFERFIFLDNAFPNNLKMIIDKKGEVIYERD